LKTFYLCFLFLFYSLYYPAQAQQRPQYTQYIFNNYVLNPAISGIENYTDCKAGYRTQWAGLDGAPVTQFFSVHSPINKTDLNTSVTSFGGQEDNPLSRSYVATYQSSDPHHGIGIYGVFDKAGPIKRFDINATYAYHLGISAKTNLSLGVAAGITSIGLDPSKINLEENDDTAIPPYLNSQIKPDVSAGLWFYGPLYFVGLSGQNLLGQTISFGTQQANNDKKGKNVRHYFLTAGYKFFLSEDIAAVPSIMFKRVAPVPNSYDANIKFSFRDKLWLGGSYRHNDSFAGILGFYFANFLNISYSYDTTISRLGSVNKGSHEVVLGFLLDNTYRVTCPQKNW
jgi:type IX secretion system PorP/SprF family membrane protein